MLEHLRSAAAQRPATALLVAALAGLVTGPLAGVAAVLAAPLAGAAARTPRMAALLLAGLAAGVLVGQERGAALERTTLGPRLGHEVRAAAELLETPRATRFGWRAAIALGGERVLLQGDGDPPRLAAGRLLDVRGVLRAPRAHEDWLRPRRLHAVLEARAVHDTGRRRGGPQGTLDAVRERAQRALGAHLPPAEGALLRGHGARGRRHARGRRARAAAAGGPRAPRRRQRRERRAPRGARGGGVRGARGRPAGAAARRAPPDRALRPARRRRAVDPAGRGDGGRGRRRDARGPPGGALARPAPGGRGDARPRPGGVARSRLAAELRGGHRDRRSSRRRWRAPCAGAACPGCSPTARR